MLPGWRGNNWKTGFLRVPGQVRVGGAAAGDVCMLADKRGKHFDHMRQPAANIYIYICTQRERERPHNIAIYSSCNQLLVIPPFFLIQIEPSCLPVSHGVVYFSLDCSLSMSSLISFADRAATRCDCAALVSPHWRDSEPAGSHSVDLIRDGVTPALPGDCQVNAINFWLDNTAALRTWTENHSCWEMLSRIMNNVR